MVAWARLRSEMSCLNRDLDEGEPGVAVYYGDGVTVHAAEEESGGGGVPDGFSDDGDDYVLGGGYYDSDEDSDF